MSHTPEPWEAVSPFPGECCWHIQRSGNEAGAFGMITYPEMGGDDAHRIVACVNACAGIPDPEKFVNDARFYSHETVTAIVKERDELMINLRCALEQRDELLRALKGLVDLDDGDESFAWDHEAEFEAGRAAIAKVKQS